MIKRYLTFTFILASSLCLCSQMLHAQTSVWNDDFSGSSLSLKPTGHLSIDKSGAGSVSQGSNQLTMNNGSNLTPARAGVYTTTDQTGTLSTINGADLYNFYDHTVIASFDIDAVNYSATTSGRPQFYFSIAKDLNNQHNPVQMDLGVSFGIELSGGTWRLFYTEKGTGAATGVIGSLSELPTGITYTLNGTLATIDITDATFTSIGNQGTSVDANTVTATIADYKADFNDDYTLAFGALNRTTLDLNAETEVILNSFSVSVIPEPYSYTLLGGCFALAWVVMVRRRKS